MKTLLIVLSELCNLNCTYCDVDKKSKKRIDPELALEEYYKMRAQYPDEMIKIDFFGGEPLLQFDLITKIVETVKGDKNVKFFMPTNGLTLDEEKIQFIIDNNIELSLSFDGLWQDKNRLQFSGQGTMHKFLAKRDMFRKIPKLKIHSMIYRGNYNLLENHLFIKNNFGVNPELTLVRDMHVWNAKSVEKLKAGISELVDWYINNPEEDMPFFILFYLRHFLTYEAKGIEIKNCGAGSSLFTFSENKIIPCNRFKGDQEAIDAIPQYAEMKECQSCEVRKYCKKGCLFEQIKNKGPIVELCDIYKFTYKEVARVTKALQHHPKFQELMLEEIKNG